MSILFSTILNQFRRRTGDYPSGSSCEFSDAEHADFCDDGIQDYNKKAIQPYTVSGSGVSMTIAPDLTGDDLELVLIYGNKVVTQLKYIKVRNKALTISDAAGRVDFYNLFKAFDASLSTIEKQIGAWETIRDQRSIEGILDDVVSDMSKYLSLSGSNV